MTAPAGPDQRWVDVGPGLRRRARPPGPWFQYHDTNGFEWNAYQLAVPGLPAAMDGYRIVHVSDLHCRPIWQTAYDELLDRLDRDVPDLIVVTGDFVDDIFRPNTGLATARRLLGGLHARAGVFGVLGNHDRYLRPAAVARLPLTLVDGRRTLVDGGRVELVGTPGPLREDLSVAFSPALPPPTVGVPRVVLSHYPDHLRRLRGARPDLFLAGHTHGGQMCLPGGWPILRHDSYKMQWRAGVNRVDRCWLVGNRGLGFSTAPVRTFCPAEVIDLHLRPEAAM